jgi:hypothetical protein
MNTSSHKKHANSSSKKARGGAKKVSNSNNVIDLTQEEEYIVPEEYRFKTTGYRYIITEDIINIIELSLNIEPKRKSGAVNMRYEFPIEPKIWDIMSTYIKEHKIWSVKQKYFQETGNNDAWNAELKRLENRRTHVMRVINEENDVVENERFAMEEEEIIKRKVERDAANKKCKETREANKKRKETREANRKAAKVALPRRSSRLNKN